MQAFDLSQILDELATEAWTNRSLHSAPSDFLLSPRGLLRSPTPTGLHQALSAMYEHARICAPGWDIPHFLPPVTVTTLPAHAGQFGVDHESYAHIAVAPAFLGAPDSALLILAHEACHHFLLQAGVYFRYKHDLILNERVTDLAMFVCGFGDIVLHGYSFVSRHGGAGVSAHLGYLSAQQYKAAYRFILDKRAPEHLPGIPQGEPVLLRLRRSIERIFGVNRARKPTTGLLEHVIRETERRP